MTVVMKIDLAGPARRGLALGLNESAGYLGVAATAFATGALAASFAPRTLVCAGALAIARARRRRRTRRPPPPRGRAPRPPRPRRAPRPQRAQAADRARNARPSRRA